MMHLTDATAEAIAQRFRALGEPMRLRILHALHHREATVGTLAERTGGGQANVSKHLQVLLQQRFVARRKEGVSTWYRIADARVFTLCDLVCGGLQEDLNQRRQLLEAR